jgi:signal transduction histidine kinase
MNARPHLAKVLIVDDLEENLLALDAILRAPEVEVFRARSGEEALELLLAHDVALAIIDVQMPDMDGFELAEMMRSTSRTKGVPIIFLTAGVRDSERVFHGYEAGAVDFLFKPIDARILKRKAQVFFDLHEQRRALADTLRLNEELMAIVSHDLRNPLNVILMAARIISSTSEEPTTLDATQRLLTSCKKMQSIIEDLFDLTRARLAGGIPVERADVDLIVVAEKVIAEFRATNPKRAIELLHRGELRGKWDGKRIEQVISNLVGNAVQHGLADSPIMLELRGDPDRAEICVRNAGTIPEDRLPHIFEAFRRGEAEGGSRGGGLGLGLYIVQQIALAHGGDANVTSSEGMTALRVELPR